MIDKEWDVNSAIERLLALRVDDVMTRYVVHIGSHQTMGDAARVLQDNKIQGAPVVDDRGCCVGVLSGADFVSRARSQTGSGGATSSGTEQVLVQDQPGDPYHVERIAGDLVSDHMSTEVRTVAETATILEAARIMCAEHVHRLIVLDPRERPTGMVSSLDLVAAMVKSIDE